MLRVLMFRTLFLASLVALVAVGPVAAGPTPLPTYPGAAATVAFDINNLGQVVGTSQFVSPLLPDRGFLLSGSDLFRIDLPTFTIFGLGLAGLGFSRRKALTDSAPTSRLLPAIGRTALRLVALTCSLLLPSAAHASLTTVNFTVVADPSDPVFAGQTASGSFSFNSTLAPPGGGQIFNTTTGLGSSSLLFVWAGTTWTRASADAYRLIFDAMGNLSGWGIEGDPLGGMTATIFPDFDVNTLTGIPSSFGFSYDYAGRVFDRGTLEMATVRTTVPEAATLALLGLGLAGLGFSRRKQ